MAGFGPQTSLIHAVYAFNAALVPSQLTRDDELRMRTSYCGPCCIQVYDKGLVKT